MRAISASLSALKAPTPCSTPRASSASVLPTPEKTIRSAVKPAAERGPHLHPGHDVGPRAQARQHAQDGPRGVGLEGVADAVGDGREGAVVGRVGVLDRGPAVDVERGAVLRRRRLEGDAVADERLTAPFEAGHGRKV